MPHVDIDYRLINPAGHHRQPRNPGGWTALPGGSHFDATGTEPITSDAPEFASKQFVFWSASDGTHGQTTTNTHISQPVGSSALQLTAWYLPTGGDGPPGPSGFLLDAFSVAHNDFVNEDFITITSDGSLTSEANVAGFVPTSSAQTGRASDHLVETGEPFESWIGASTASGRDATFAQGTFGFAIATYRSPDPIDLPEIEVPAMGWLLILGGVKVDGGGIVIGPGGGPVPVGPWGPLVARLVNAVAAGSAGARIKGKAGLQIQQLAAAELVGLAEANLKQLKGKRIG